VQQRRPRKKKAPADTMKDTKQLFVWKSDQKDLAMTLWIALENEDREAQMHALLRSLRSFIFVLYGNDIFSSGLIHFLALLGIDTEMNRLRTARNYSYMLAGVVYCTRVLAVEKLLPTAQRESMST
jgi:hypothetical protein